jgi:hypothetical protein
MNPAILPLTIREVEFLPGDGRRLAPLKRYAGDAPCKQSRKARFGKLTIDQVEDSFRNNVIAKIKVRPAIVQMGRRRSTSAGDA